MKAELIIGNRLKQADADIALDAVYKALTMIYENKDAAAQVAERKPKKLSSKLNKPPRIAPFIGQIRERGAVRGYRVKRKAVPSDATHLASIILVEIEANENRPISSISPSRLGKYTGVLSNFAKSQMLSSVKTDHASIEKVKRELASVKF